MTQRLKNKKVAILATDGFEEVELTSPKQALEEAGASVDIVSIKNGKIKSWKDGNWNKEFEVDKTVDEVKADNYDSLLLPGGVINPDKLRREKNAISFAKDFFRQGKPIAAICHGPWLLIETGALEGRKLTSFHSIKTDLINAGAQWVNEEVVVDEGLTTSRSPDDLEAFNAKMIEEFGEGIYEEQKTV